MSVSAVQLTQGFRATTLRQLINQRQSRANTRALHLTEEELTRIGVNSEISTLQSCVPRIRHGYRGQPQGGGSAFVISPDGFLLTADHVIRLIDGDELFADFPLFEGLSYPVKITPDEIDPEINEPKPGRKIKVFPMPVRVVARSPHDDLALLVVALPESEDPWRYIELSSKIPQKGESSIQIGHHSCERHNILTTGEVISPRMLFETYFNDNFREKVKWFFTATWQRSLRLYPRFGATISSNQMKKGDSGGLLCDVSGKACGVLHGFVPKWLIAIRNIVNGISGGRLLDSNKNIRHETMSINEDRINPFLTSLGIDPDSLRQGKPIRLSNVVEKLFKKKLNS